MTLLATMKQWLEALESCGEAHITDGGYQWHDAKLVDTAITSLRKAIQEEALRNVQRLGQEIEQEPVSYQSTQEKCAIETVPAQGGLLPTMREGKDFTITHPPQRTEQEPIANLEIVDLGDGNKLFDNHWLSDLYSLPCGDYLLYTHPPQRTWVGLTNDEIVECWARPTMWATAHAIEAKLKEKNT